MTRRRFLALVAILVGAWAIWRFWYVPHQEANVEACARCLPNGLTLSTEFSDSPEVIDPLRRTIRVVTVRQKLFQIGAYCEKGVIYDRWGRRVYLFHVREWGTVPSREKFMEWQEQDRQELRRLEAQGTVIRMYATREPV